MTDLSNQGLGTIKEMQVGSSRKKTTCFMKNFDLNEELGKKLIEFDVSLEEYVKSLQTSSEEDKELSMEYKNKT
jgi:hypothetical protein